MRALLATTLLTVLGLVRPAGADVFEKGPYVQHVTTGAVTIMWQSDGPTAGKVIVHSPVEPDHLVTEGAPARMHEVRVEGLKPGRRYGYTVEVGGERAAGEFATAPAGAEPFSFVVFGDSRSNADSHRAVAERVRREVPDFILGTGDMVNNGHIEADWQTFFDIERELLRDNVLYPSLGNHDREPRPARTAENFRKYFALPTESPEPERYYAFTYGNSRFLVLDSNSYSFALTDQTAWIERQLEQAVSDPTIQHIFVSMHHPPYSTAIHGGQPELREMWTPLYVKYGVDAVFSGHDHTYERSEMDGVRYFVSGGGGAPLYPKDPRPAAEDVKASQYFERTFNYLRVQVVGDFVEVAAVRDDGSLIESLSWGNMPARPVAEIARPAPAPLPPLAAAATPTASPAAGSGCAVGGRWARGGAAVAGLCLVAVIACLRRRRATSRKS